MFGTPHDIFGEGKFGSSDFGRITIYESLPREHRRLDKDNGYPLKKLLASFQTEIEALRDRIENIPNQRDPLFVNSSNVPTFTINSIQQHTTGIIEVQTTEKHEFTYGDFVMFAGTNSTPELLAPLEVSEIVSEKIFRVRGTVTGIGTQGTCCLFSERGSIVKITGWREYTDAYQTNYVSDVGMIEFDIDPNCDLSKIGVGYSSLFNVAAPIPPIENLFVEPEVFSYRVLRITRRNGPTGTNKILCVGSRLPNQATVDTVVAPITMLFTRQNLIGTFANDFGIKFDEDDPESFQRSQVKNVVEFILQKSSKKGYEIRSLGAGFEVDVQGLHVVCEDAISSVPPTQIYEINGKKYTDFFEDTTTVQSGNLTFDDLAADFSFTDPETSATEFPMDGFISLDASLDAHTYASAFALCTKEVTVVGVRPATATELSPHSMFDGVVATVSFGSLSDRDIYGTFNNGAFDLAGPNTDGIYGDYVRRQIIEELSYSSGVGEYLIADSPISPPPTGTYCIRYIPQSVPTNQFGDCCLCKTYSIRLILTPTTEFKEQTNFSGKELIDAVLRLVRRLEYEQLPIHAKIIEIVLNIANIDIDVPNFTIQTSIESNMIIPVYAVNRYDNIPADDATADENVQSITVTIS